MWDHIYDEQDGAVTGRTIRIAGAAIDEAVRRCRMRWTINCCCQLLLRELLIALVHQDYLLAGVTGESIIVH